MFNIIFYDTICQVSFENRKLKFIICRFEEISIRSRAFMIRKLEYLTILFFVIQVPCTLRGLEGCPTIIFFEMTRKRVKRNSMSEDVFCSH